MSTSNTPNIEKPKFQQSLFIALALVIILHGLVLPYTSVNTYDAYIHMFFGDHYARSWMDPWEPRWYTGFTTTSYPPGTHMLIAVLSRVMSLINAFNLVMLTGLCILVLGIFRFSMLFVSPRAAGYSAILAALSTSIGETVHLFGQLPTIVSLGLFLNGMPHVYRWLINGSFIQLLQALCFAAGTTAAHHVTTIFGTILFIGPVGIYAWIVHSEMNPKWREMDRSKLSRAHEFLRPLKRGAILGLLLAATVIITVYPYWYWSVTDPITQVSIPHGSRENFIKRLDLGFIFFVIPWSWLILVVPYTVYAAFKSRMWPLSASVILCLILGTGGTTPLSRMILGPAFDILTLDRFTFWSTILILPFAGTIMESALHGSVARIFAAVLGRRAYMAGLIAGFGMMLLAAISVASLSKFRPSQPERIDPTPIVSFLKEDQHDRWRYMTLGFGDQFSYISALTNARSVDGNYHSARRLPELVNYAVERLENSKYLGVPGLGSLQQFLVNTDKYNLKFIFSNDGFYDPLLHFTGWNRLVRLSNNVTVWEKPDVLPLPTLERRKTFPKVHRLMWGILPPTGLFLAFSMLTILVVVRSRGFHPEDYRPKNKPKTFLSNKKKARLFIRAMIASAFVAIASILIFAINWTYSSKEPEVVLADYYYDLDYRKFERAFTALAPEENLDFETFLLWRRWVGGMIASFAKISKLEINQLAKTSESIDLEAKLEYLTPFGTIKDRERHHLVLINGEWKLASRGVNGYTPPSRLQSEPVVSWQRAGKRTPTKDVSHRDILDRPRVSVLDARLVERANRYHLVGTVRNDDVDPAAVNYKGFLLDDVYNVLSNQQAGVGSSHRLLPGEVGFFDIIFEGVYSIEDGKNSEAFDPNLYVPVILNSEPSTAGLNVDAVVSAENLYQSISGSSIEIVEQDDKYYLKGLLSNVGSKQAQLVQVQYTVFDKEGRVAMVGHDFLNSDIKPGQSRNFSFEMKITDEYSVVSEVPGNEIRTNGIGENALNKRVPITYQPGFIPLPESSRYCGVIISIETMNFKPLF